ncbi:3D domain-containing protein [Collibacillus ludicampi]|nr:3D domain-containing protein [Collibacillus ludicampi]
MGSRRWGMVVSIGLWTLSAFTLPAGAATPETRSAPGQTNTAGADFIQYSVSPDDTLWDIANRYHTTVERLLSLNPNVRPDQLKIGSHLVIPRLHDEAKPVMAEQGKVIITASGERFRVRHVLNCKLTAYTSGYESTGKRPGDPGYGITSSGRVATIGRTIAVDPEVISIGSKVYIEGLGIRYAEDTGGAIKGHHIDVYVGDGGAVKQALEFGVKQDVPVFILED